MTKPWVIEIFLENGELEWKTLKPDIFTEKINGKTRHHNGAFTGDEIESLGWIHNGKYRRNSSWHYTLEEAIRIGTHLFESWDRYASFRLRNVRSGEEIPCCIL